MLSSDTKRRIDNCRDYLVGKLPLPTDQVELITLALIYKFMDDMDEQSVALGGKRAFFTGTLATYRWRAILSKTLPAKDRMDRFAGGLEALGDPATGAHLPELFRDIFRNAFLKFRDGKTFALFAGEIDGFTYSHSEELGNAFEYLLQCMGTQGQNGQFRTPRHIIDFVIACLDPQPGEKLLDPACGTGGFLVSAYKHILQKHSSPGAPGSGDRLREADRRKVYAGLSGYDITDFMVKLSKVNLFLHGFPSPDIAIYDTLSNDARWDEKADIIAANPPFMTPKGGVTPHGRFRIPAKKAEVLFTDYIAEHLTPRGRAGIIVPNGIVATTQNAYVKLRRFLIEDGLVAVVSLPAGVFRPYSGVKTSILFLDKSRARSADRSVLFLTVNADGFDLGDKRTPVADDDLPEARRVIESWLRDPKQGIMSPLPHRLVPATELLAHKNASLQAERFFGGGELTESDSKWPVTTIGKIARVVSGNGFPLEHQGATNGEIPFYKVSDMNLAGNERNMISHNNAVTRETLIKLKAKSHPPGTIIFPKVGAAIATNKKRILTRESAFDNNVMGIICGPEVEAKFLLAWLDGFNISEWASTSEPPSMRQSTVEEQEIILPPLDEQRRIVAEIEGYQKVIDGARQVVEGYKAIIPAKNDWPVVALSEIIEGKPKNGYSGTPVKHVTATKVLSLSATTSGTLNVNHFKYLDEDIPLNAECRCRRDDIYLQRGNTRELVGTAALFDSDATDFLYPDLMIRVRADKTKVIPKFLLHSLQSPASREYFSQNASGAAASMSKITQSIVEAVEIPLPPLDEQRRIVAELEAEAAQIEAVRGLITRFEGKIRRVLDTVWAGATAE